IVYSGKTTKEALKYTVRRLRQVHAPLVGAVLNNVDLESADYSYYASSYYAYSSGETEGLLEETDEDNTENRKLGRESA
ncbi:MAG: hypothetical protein WD356_01915, partial [Pseudomonadales bacterium]